MSSNSRHLPVISTQVNDTDNGDHWLKQFEKNLQKGAVQPVSNTSLFDQINSVMNGTKSKYQSVDAAVNEMKERSGLTAYLEKVKISEEQIENSTTKTAQSTVDEQQAIDKTVDIIPIVIKKCPSIRGTLENYIKDTRGNIPVPAIISKLQSIHQNDCSDIKDWDDDNLIRLVSKLNLQEKANNPDNFIYESNLGRRDIGSDTELDPSNTDAFFSLMPVKI